jgi:hypothetical protein
MRLEVLEPGRVGDMAGRNAETADEQKSHGDEQQGADADAGQ